MEQKNKTLCLVGGGSGGHLLPLMTEAKQWLSKHPDGKIVMITHNSKLEKEVLEHYPFINKTIFISLGMRGKTSRITLLYQLIKSFFKSLNTLRNINPDIVMSSGGLVALPVCMAAWLLRFPIHLFELNAEPGKAISFLAPFSTRIHVAFKSCISPMRSLRKDLSTRCIYNPYPLRYTDHDKNYSHSSVLTCINELVAYQPWNKDFLADRTTLLVLGGSQGSSFLNSLITSFITKQPVLHNKLQVIHQTGSVSSDVIRSTYQAHNIPALVFSYYPDPKIFYQGADIVIARAGAGTLFELAFFGKKSIIIPLSSSTTDHQKANAIEMQNLHPDLFTILDQSKITLDYQHFEQEILRFINNPTQLS